MSTSTLNHSPRILLVETDEVLAQHASLDLRKSGYDPLVAADAANGLHQVYELQPSLVVVDRILAGESGLRLCNYLRSAGARMPVLLLMARDSIEDRVACLEAGADDYFLKPYRTEEFLQLVRIYLKPDAPSTEQLRFDGLVLDLETRAALRNGRTIDLTMKEFELLKYLMEHPREVLTREQILENVWGYDFLGASNVIEVYIRYLRLKIEDEGEKRLIHTVRELVMSYESPEPKLWGLPVLGIILGFMLMGCLPPATELPSSSQASPSVTQANLHQNNSGQSLPISAQAHILSQVIDLEVAQTPQQQAIGLMHRTALADNRGMLFPFNPPQPVSFWMKNVSIPLDIIFLRNGKVVEIAANVPPCTTVSCPVYGPDALINQVIELRGGRVAELGLQIGDSVSVRFLSTSKI